MTKTTKLHEVLAVEGDKEGIAKKIISETDNVFKSKHNLFLGSTKTLKMDKAGMESTEEAAKEITEIVTTVNERLDYTQEAVAAWLDVVLTKEATNQEARADLVVGSVVIAENVPATFLLGLETKLKSIRNMYNNVPTLAPGVVWEKDEVAGHGIYRTANPEVRAKTAKVPQFKVLYEATKEHPAQIERWNEEVTVGRFTQTVQSAMMPAARKAEILGRLDKLIQATKQARMRANNVEIVDSSIGGAIFDYITS